MLDEQGIETGVDLDALISVSQRILGSVGPAGAACPGSCTWPGPSSRPAAAESRSARDGRAARPSSVRVEEARRSPPQLPASSSGRVIAPARGASAAASIVAAWINCPSRALRSAPASRAAGSRSSARVAERGAVADRVGLPAGEELDQPDSCSACRPDRSDPADALARAVVPRPEERLVAQEVPGGQQVAAVVAGLQAHRVAGEQLLARARVVQRPARRARSRRTPRRRQQGGLERDLRARVGAVGGRTASTPRSSSAATTTGA